LFLTVLARFVPALSSLTFGQVFLVYPASRAVVRILVPDSVAQRCCALIMAITKMGRHFTYVPVTDCGASIPDGERRSVALRSGGQVNSCVSQMELRLRQPYVLKRVSCRNCYVETSAVSETHVLTGEND
jgi:hypothetical protein